MYGTPELLHAPQFPQEEVSLVDDWMTKLPVPVVENPFDWPAVEAVACWGLFLPKAQEETTAEKGL